MNVLNKFIFFISSRRLKKRPGGINVSKPAAETSGTLPAELTPLPPQVLGEERADRFHCVRPPRHPIHPVEEARGGHTVDSELVTACFMCI
ncbi:uncharacterized protein TNCT_78591 [Trichonephila clavata]|uniref:Uncharacterized protein n=1 Tax=Trichonephila clavata TaxID=2740835 RepID=A0A8X6KV48_TRICU|nr:uncharacterized protein TNCT_78591 [Trichonephila clavata]